MDSDTENITDLVNRIGSLLLERKEMLATAESCTGGWVGQAITSVAGSSHWYDRGFITYSNSAKREMLGVPTETIARYGAVSEQTVRAMSEGALERSRARIALAITGIAGPEGGSADKPVGYVCFSWAGHNRETISECKVFKGDRQQIRRQSVQYSLNRVLRYIC